MQGSTLKTSDGAEKYISAEVSTLAGVEVDSLEDSTPQTTDEKDFCAHILPAENVALRLRTSIRHGLTRTEAAARLASHGPNIIRGAKGPSLWRIFIQQVANALTIVLIAVTALSFAIHDYIEGAVVLAVIILNIGVGLVQDFRAEQTIQSLYALATPRCKVVRNGRNETIKAERLVPGDLVSLVTGDIVPADLRLVQGFNLATDEAHLTGESVAIGKRPHAVFQDPKLPMGDRTNLAFSGSSVTRGRATGLVISTGMDTEVGQIAELLRRKKQTLEGNNLLTKAASSFYRGLRGILGLEGTPLQNSLSKFALLLFAFASLLIIIVFSVSRFLVTDDVLLYGICIGVAVIPESLLAVLTVTMAVATKAMVKGHVIVRQMPSLEAVGGVTSICSDKTGTLTQGRMITRKVWLRDGLLGTVEGKTDSYDPGSGVVRWSGPLSGSCFTAFLSTLTLCNNAIVTDNRKDNDTDSSCATTTSESTKWQATGEPTEIALKVFALRHGHDQPSTEHLKAEHPFDSACKLMSVVYGASHNDELRVHSKGAVEVMLPLLGEDDALKKAILNEAEGLAESGLRVLCVADKIMFGGLGVAQNRREVEQNLRFLGLVGLYDPPRPETAEAVRQCRRAGISVHMVTGDHVKTATAIAYEVGILSEGRPPGPGTVMTAAEFGSLGDDEIDRLPALPTVIARCSPLTKVRVIEALHRRKAFCIMTGDGVNDSPALRQADVGIAMGDRGSDVAKEASDMVLMDDNFASIVTAISEGRRLTDNIQKVTRCSLFSQPCALHMLKTAQFLLHLLTSNLAQVILLLAALAFKDEEGIAVFPLSPVEILWANLVTSSPLALGLGLEEAQPDILQRPPRNLRSSVFTQELVQDQLLYGSCMGTLSLAAFILVAFVASGRGIHVLPHGCNDASSRACHVVYRARATTFSTLSFLLLITAWEVKHFDRSLFAMDKRWAGPFSVFRAIHSNRFLFWAVIAGLLSTFVLVYIPFVNKSIFKHQGISWEWGVVIGCVLTYVVFVEAWKAIKRRWKGGTDETDRGCAAA